MTFSDDNPQFPSSSPEIPQPLSPAVSQVPAVTEIPPGDPFTYGAHHPQPYHFAPPPADLQIPWSWGISSALASSVFSRSFSFSLASPPTTSPRNLSPPTPRRNRCSSSPSPGQSSPLAAWFFGTLFFSSFFISRSRFSIAAPSG